MEAKQINKWLISTVGAIFTANNTNKIDIGDSVTAKYIFAMEEDKIPTGKVVLDLETKALDNEDFEVIANLMPESASYSIRSGSNDFLKLTILMS